MRPLRILAPDNRVNILRNPDDELTPALTGLVASIDLIGTEYFRYFVTWWDDTVRHGTWLEAREVEPVSEADAVWWVVRSAGPDGVDNERSL